MLDLSFAFEGFGFLIQASLFRGFNLATGQTWDLTVVVNGNMPRRNCVSQEGNSSSLPAAGYGYGSKPYTPKDEHPTFSRLANGTDLSPRRAAVEIILIISKQVLVFKTTLTTTIKT